MAAAVISTIQSVLTSGLQLLGRGVNDDIYVYEPIKNTDRAPKPVDKVVAAKATEVLPHAYQAPRLHRKSVDSHFVPMKSTSLKPYVNKADIIDQCKGWGIDLSPQDLDHIYQLAKIELTKKCFANHYVASGAAKAPNSVDMKVNTASNSTKVVDTINDVSFLNFLRQNDSQFPHLPKLHLFCTKQSVFVYLKVANKPKAKPAGADQKSPGAAVGASASTQSPIEDTTEMKGSTKAKGDAICIEFSTSKDPILTLVARLRFRSDLDANTREERLPKILAEVDFLGQFDADHDPHVIQVRHFAVYEGKTKPAADKGDSKAAQASPAAALASKSVPAANAESEGTRKLKKFILYQERFDGDISTRLKEMDSKKPDFDKHCFVEQAFLALKSVHDKGIIHRDIKPQNFLSARKPLDKKKDGAPDNKNEGKFVKEKCVVSDFDMATRDGKGEVAGTPEYFPPELAVAQWGAEYDVVVRDGDKAMVWEDSAGKPHDIYSLGLTLYESVTGIPHPMALLNLTGANLLKMDNDIQKRMASANGEEFDELQAQSQRISKATMANYSNLEKALNAANKLTEAELKNPFSKLLRGCLRPNKKERWTIEKTISFFNENLKGHPEIINEYTGEPLFNFNSAVASGGNGRDSGHSIDERIALAAPSAAKSVALTGSNGGDSVAANAAQSPTGSVVVRLTG